MMRDFGNLHGWEEMLLILAANYGRAVSFEALHTASTRGYPDVPELDYYHMRSLMARASRCRKELAPGLDVWLIRSERAYLLGTKADRDAYRREQMARERARRRRTHICASCGVTFEAGVRPGRPYWYCELHRRKRLEAAA